MIEKANTLLREDELCVVVVRGIEHDVSWSRHNGCFYFADQPAHAERDKCGLAEVIELRPASVKL